MTQSSTRYSIVRYQLPFVLWAALIFLTSSIPGRDIPKVDIPYADKIVHFVIFLVFCALTDRAIRFQGRFPSLSKYHLVFSVLITIAYGVFDEGHQLFVPNRDASLRDLAADAIGAVLYVLLFLALSRHFSGKKQSAV